MQTTKRPGKRGIQLNVYLTAGEHQAYLAGASNLGMTLSAFVRLAALRLVESQARVMDSAS